MFLNPTSDKERRYLLAFQVSITATCLGLWTLLGGESLLNSDDVLYAQMARESLANGSYVEHSWMGVTLFEKPPLLLWLLQLSGALFGFSDAAMRLPAAIGATLTLVYVYKLTRLIILREDRWMWPWLSVALLVASWTFMEAGGRVMTDSLLSASVVAMCYYALKLEQSEQTKWSVCLGLAAGLGFMAKSFALGPAAVSVMGYLLWRKHYKGLLVALGSASLVALPWHVLMTLRHGTEFWEVYVGYHVLGRAQGIAVGQHGPEFYFSEMLTSDPLVIMVLLPGLIICGGYILKRKETSPLLPLMMACIGLVFLHVSQTKFLHYMLPVIPLMVVVTTFMVTQITKRKFGFQLMIVLAIASLSSYPQAEPNTSYQPELRHLAKKFVEPLPIDARLIVFNEYAPALYYYGQREGELWTDSERFYAIQQSIDMMRRSEIVHQATSQKLTSLRNDNRAMILIAPHARMDSMAEEVKNNPMSQVLRRLLNDFAQDKRKFAWHREFNHLIVHVEARR